MPVHEQLNARRETDLSNAQGSEPSEKPGRSKTPGCAIAILLAVGAAVVLPCAGLVGLSVLGGALRDAELREIGPKLEVFVSKCERNSSYLVGEGYVWNRSEASVHFVTVTGRFYDPNGMVVDTEWTYAVGAEYLRPGERSTFRMSTQHGYATKCGAELSKFQTVR